MHGSAAAMQRRVESALVAKVGAFVFAGILGMPAALPASGAQVQVLAAAATMSEDAGFAALLDPSSELADLRAAVRTSPVARGAAEDVQLGAARAPEEPPAPEPVAAPPPPPPPPAPIVAQPVTSGAFVLASWYGPGFYGDRTACGLTFTPEILGVAHLTLPCGTKVTLTSPVGRTITVPVIDRGPYVAGRTLDLSFATKNAIGCSDLCTVRMVLGP